MEAPVTLSCAWALLVPQELCSYQDLISMGTLPTLGTLTPVSFIQSISPRHKESKQGNYPASAFSLVQAVRGLNW